MPKNQNAERDNPCLKEQDLTYKCLGTHNYDREKCEVYFKNYNNCRDFWSKVKSDRRMKGIVPHLPNLEDRPEIKAEYMKTKPQ